jgi:hypothetical protein
VLGAIWVRACDFKLSDGQRAQADIHPSHMRHHHRPGFTITLIELGSWQDGTQADLRQLRAKGYAYKILSHAAVCWPLGPLGCLPTG